MSYNCTNMQYMDKFRVKRAANFEARIRKYIWALNVQIVYGWIAREARRKFWSINVQNYEIMRAAN